MKVHPAKSYAYIVFTRFSCRSCIVFILSMQESLTLFDFQAVLLLSKISRNIVGDPIERERVHDAVDCLLSFVV